MNNKIPHFKLYYIAEDYIEYLRKFDQIVSYNKSNTRPYVGIVYTYNNMNYFAPLSSPKTKHEKMKNTQPDVYKIDNGRLGIVNINNMIPTPKECLKEVIPTVKDEKYKNLLQNQLAYINKPINALNLLKKINYFQKRYREKNLPDVIVKRSCNFILLEEKCKQWENNTCDL